MCTARSLTVSPLRCTHPWMQTRPCEQNSRHTLVKILPCPKLRLRAVKLCIYLKCSSLRHYVTPDSAKGLPLTYKWTLSSIRLSFHFNLKLFSPLFAAVDVTNNGTSKTGRSQAGSKTNLFLQAYVKVKQYSNNKHCHTERINIVIINKQNVYLLRCYITVYLRPILYSLWFIYLCTIVYWKQEGKCLSSG